MYLVGGGVDVPVGAVGTLETLTVRVSKQHGSRTQCLLVVWGWASQVISISPGSSPANTVNPVTGSRQSGVSDCAKTVMGIDSSAAVNATTAINEKIAKIPVGVLALIVLIRFLQPD